MSDQIFITRANKKASEDLGIRLNGKSLGRKSQDKKKAENKKKFKDKK